MPSPPLVNFSEVESRRFDLDVYRGRIVEGEERRLVDEILNARADLVVLRTPCEQDVPGRLERYGLPLKVCDTLVYYEVPLARFAPATLRNFDLDFVEYEPAADPEMDALVAEVFSGYRNHYSTNPLLAKDLVPGYQEWTRGFARGREAGKVAWIVRRGGEAIAFATCSRAGLEAEGVLYGVRAAHSGGGVYGDLIRFTQGYFKDLGCTSMKVSTQVSNFGVQKVWVREGFFMTSAYYTLHLTTMMGRGLRDVLERPVLFTTEQVEAFGALSGDRNPLHFSDAAARERGFEGRMAHGALLNASVSKIFGVERPGPGTLFAGFAYRFLTPLYVGREYQLRVGFFPREATSKFRRALATVRDSRGALCAFAYSDLVVR